MNYGNQNTGKGRVSRIAREGYEDVVPADREAAYEEEVGEEPVVDTPKTTWKNKQNFLF